VVRRASFLVFSTIASPGLVTAALIHVAAMWYATGSQVSRLTLPFSSTAARLVSATSQAVGASSLLMYRGYVEQATVLVFSRSCTGFIAGEPNLVVTAAHCIPHGERKITVLTARNQRIETRVLHIDRNTDLAVLRLPRALDIPPLPLAANLPEEGEPLLFAGRRDRPGSAQVGAVQKIGRCPSLPHVARAIFTSLGARPGDSGAPVLDSELRVVGIIHGGARCHILAPVAPLGRQFENERPDSHSRA
jgi:S1-C subfamily serine protease